jgi:splicing factor 45
VIGRHDDGDDRWIGGNDNDYERPSALAYSSVTAPADVNMTGDEAYQRRLAMSTGLQPPSNRPREPSPSASVSSTFAPPPREETGDEAYQRRLAMSQARPPPAQETGSEEFMRRTIVSPAPQEQSLFPPQDATPEEDEPPFAGGYNPFAPREPPPPPPQAATVGHSASSFEDRVQTSKNAAAAIAAKLAALAPAMSMAGDASNSSALISDAKSNEDTDNR